MYKVIIAEDDPMVAMINEQFVQRTKGFLLAGSFRDGGEALEYLELHDADLLILDVYMPRMDGFATLRQIRKRQIYIDVIMVTAANEREAVEEALRLGIVDYLVKPFTFDRFQMALKKFAAQSDVFRNRETFDQRGIDSIIESARGTAEDLHPKGIQTKTLELILTQMRQSDDQLTGDEIAFRTGLTGVTARRYLNYLAETGRVVGEMNYETGGRPSMRYRIRE